MKPPLLLQSSHFTVLPSLPNPHLFNRPNFSIICSTKPSIASFKPNSVSKTPILGQNTNDSTMHLSLVEMQNPSVSVPPLISSWNVKFSWNNRASFLFTFIVCTTSVALVSFVATAVPTLFAMGRAAKSFAKLADAAREELPGTMAAIRLSGMEISDLTLEMSDLSQEISEGVSKSAQAVQAAEKGVRQIGSVAREQTALMIEERANLPAISFQPVVLGAAKKTSHALNYATRMLRNMFSGGENMFSGGE